MLKQLVNECKFTLEITTDGPVLVKSGHATPHGPDMSPVLTYRNGQEQVFLPGSSLKGVCRSHVEKVIRSLNADEQVICPTFGERSCGDKFQRRKDALKQTKKDLENEEVYRDSCMACRLFGSTFFTGRVALGDAYLTGEVGVEKFTEDRDGVGIDRFSGGAAHGAKFELRVVRAGVTFATEIYMRNFEIWQLGALMVFLQDLEDGLIRVGSGRSRGLGSVKGRVASVNIQYLQPLIADKQANAIWGLGKFEQDARYGLTTTDHLTVEPAPVENRQGIRSVQQFTGDSLANLKRAAMERFIYTIQHWSALRDGQPV